MSLDYDYELATSEPPRRVAEVVRAAAQRADLIDPAVTVDQVLDGWTTTHGTWFRVVESRERTRPTVVEQSFGFATTVRVAFSLGTADHRDLDQQEDDIVRVVSALLDAVPGDAALMYADTDDAWLLRRGGDLAVSEDDELWPAHRLALLPQPHRRATYSLT